MKSLGVPLQREQFDPIQQHYDPGATLVSVSHGGNVRRHMRSAVDVATIARNVIVRIEDLNLVHGPAPALPTTLQRTAIPDVSVMLHALQRASD